MAKIIRFPVERIRRNAFRERQLVPMPLGLWPFAVGTHLWLLWTEAWLGCMGSAARAPGRKSVSAMHGISRKRRT
ncbi:hypothetical protein GCM10007160_11300 [Litchfieldella qijiaojingensis]|uniref:Uncharacterized protein n=1 Tax=Litchfieldella qijiaojingensis TaxID=980347 RepID=A0ABQ2YL29_9GAMM|nr:hypothetical protein [Halomonas qijiaojingensis]GGX85850.1 hypothetical protein GCM10007160_11300 [Halomonas qijiaojingensis]